MPAAVVVVAAEQRFLANGGQAKDPTETETETEGGSRQSFLKNARRAGILLLFFVVIC